MRFRRAIVEEPEPLVQRHRLDTVVDREEAVMQVMEIVVVPETTFTRCHELVESGMPGAGLSPACIRWNIACRGLEGMTQCRSTPEK